MLNQFDHVRDGGGSIQSDGRVCCVRVDLSTRGSYVEDVADCNVDDMLVCVCAQR